MQLRPIQISFYPEKLWFAINLILFKILLSLHFIRMSDEYAYYGVVLNPRDILTVTTSWIVFVLMSFTIKYKLDRVSTMLHFFIFFLSYIPISVHFELNAGRPWLPYFGVTVVMLILSISQHIQPAENRYFKGINESLFLFLVGFLTLIFLLVVMVDIGFSNSIPSISEIYEQRAFFKENATRISKYAFNWLANAINIVLLAIALSKRNIILGAISIFISVYLYSIGGHKTVLLMAPAIASIYFLYKLFSRHFILFFSVSVVMVLLVLLLVDVANGETNLISSILVRRGMILPGQYIFEYFQFSQTHPLNYFSQNLPFSLFMESHYEDPVPLLIGKEFYSFSEENHANGNVFADSLVNVGVFAFPLSLVVLFGVYRVFDMLATYKSKIIVLALIFASVQSLINSGFIVSFVTHGILITALLVMFYPVNSKLATTLKNPE